MSRIDIDRARASYAFKVVKDAKNNEKYGSQVEKLPMMIHNSGLRNTLAFAHSKGYMKGDGKGEEWILVSDHLMNWLVTEPTNFFGQTFQLQNNKTAAEANLGKLINLGDYEYRFATQEVFALVNWMRKLVKGEEQKPAKKEKEEVGNG